jgi:hypothetical protein
VGVLLLLGSLYGTWKAYRWAPHEQKSLPLAALLALLSTCVTGLVDVPLDKTEVAVLLFLLVGMALGYAERLRQRAAGLAAPGLFSSISHMLRGGDV